VSIQLYSKRTGVSLYTQDVKSGVLEEACGLLSVGEKGININRFSAFSYWDFFRVRIEDKVECSHMHITLTPTHGCV